MRAPTMLCAAVLCWAGLAGSAAHADLQVRSPIVDYQEIEVEHNGLVTIGGRRSDRSQSYTYELGYGVLPFWKFSIEAETGAEPGGRFSYQATTFENVFQLTPQGEFWLDAGFFAE